MAHKFQLGQTVTNYGMRATVWAYHTTAGGIETGDLILVDDMGFRWVADPNKCEPAFDEVKHSTGFVTF